MRWFLGGLWSRGSLYKKGIRRIPLCGPLETCRLDPIPVASNGVDACVSGPGECLLCQFEPTAHQLPASFHQPLQRALCALLACGCGLCLLHCASRLPCVPARPRSLCCALQRCPHFSQGKGLREVVEAVHPPHQVLKHIIYALRSSRCIVAARVKRPHVQLVIPARGRPKGASRDFLRHARPVDPLR